MWKERSKQLKVEGKTLTQIYNIVQTEYLSDLNLKQVEEKVRPILRREAKKSIEKQEVVGVISDTHFPFVHPNYIHFLEDTFNKHKVTRIVHIGDLCDFHAISRHQTETTAVDAVTEYNLARAQIDLYTRAFPKVDLTLGNHCTIAVRQAATLGIPKQFLKDFPELWGLPKGWNIHEQFILNNVLYEHGINWVGKHGALDKATITMMSCVIGHSHSNGGCAYRSNAKSIVFGLNVGAGVDISAYAFAYGRYSKNRETLGCGIVFD